MGIGLWISITGIKKIAKIGAMLIINHKSLEEQNKTWTKDKEQMILHQINFRVHAKQTLLY